MPTCETTRLLKEPELHLVSAVSENAERASKSRGPWSARTQMRAESRYGSPKTQHGVNIPIELLVKEHNSQMFLFILCIFLMHHFDA
jgi:hypothetical protein